DTNLRVLQEKLRQTEGDEHTRNAQFAKDKAAMAADKRKIQELEQQVVTLTDSLEMLTLDKEQLAVDKEILEDNIAVRSPPLTILRCLAGRCFAGHPRTLTDIFVHVHWQ